MSCTGRSECSAGGRVQVRTNLVRTSTGKALNLSSTVYTSTVVSDTGTAVVSYLKSCVYNSVRVQPYPRLFRMRELCKPSPSAPSRPSPAAPRTFAQHRHGKASRRRILAAHRTLPRRRTRHTASPTAHSSRGGARSRRGGAPGAPGEGNSRRESDYGAAMDVLLILIAITIAVMVVVMNFLLLVTFSHPEDKNQAWTAKIIVVRPPLASSTSPPHPCSPPPPPPGTPRTPAAHSHPAPECIWCRLRTMSSRILPGLTALAAQAQLHRLHTTYRVGTLI
eukprot:SAG31_NODE_2747_length_5147_cov_3.881933_1_plen_279_part_00